MTHDTRMVHLAVIDHLRKPASYMYLAVNKADESIKTMIVESIEI